MRPQSPNAALAERNLIPGQPIVLLEAAVKQRKRRHKLAPLEEMVA
jgi:hypothetical protein